MSNISKVIMRKGFIILVVLSLTFSSCGIIGFVKGTDVGKEKFAQKIILSNLPLPVKEKAIGNYFYDGNQVIYVIDDNCETQITIKRVTRCYWPMCGMENKHNKTLLKAGYHFEYKGVLYYFSRSTGSPKIIFENKLYYTFEHSFFWGGYKPWIEFYAVELE